MSIEEFARLRGALESEASPRAVLDRAGLTQEDWAAATFHHLTVLEQEMKARGRDVATRYLAAYGGAGIADAAFADQTLPVASAGPMTLPFRAGQGEAEPAPLSFADPSGETMGPVSSPAAPSMPFGRVTVDLLRMDRYSAMAAEIRVDPESAESIMARFGLRTSEERNKIHQLWRLRFEGNPELQARFDAAVRERVDALRRRS